VPGILRKDSSLKPEEVSLVVHGRSLGSTCAVHLAARGGNYELAPSALVVESGFMSLLDLPMVQKIGCTMPQLMTALLQEPCPLDTLQDMSEVTLPTLLLHGDRDEMCPIDQAIGAHKACASSVKKLVRFPRCHHNDLRVGRPQEYFAELRMICQVAAGLLEADALLEDEEEEPGFLGIVTGALRCFPGMRRCLAPSIQANQP